MGLFGGGNSKTKVVENTTNVTTNQVDNSVYELEGGAILGSNNYIVNTDHNAIGSAMDLAKLSVNVADSISRAGMNLGLRTNETVAELSRDSLASVADAYQSASADSNSLFDKALSYLSNMTGSTVDALNKIAKEQNTSADQRVADISSNAIKYTVIAVSIGLVAVVWSRSK